MFFDSKILKFVPGTASFAQFKSLIKLIQAYLFTMRQKVNNHDNNSGRLRLNVFSHKTHKLPI